MNDNNLFYIKFFQCHNNIKLLCPWVSSSVFVKQPDNCKKQM